jgi:hypothetical protein
MGPAKTSIARAGVQQQASGGNADMAVTACNPGRMPKP